MPSVADDCWRLSADCSHWAEESRDNAARLAFRQMATAWAGLAFSQDFALPTDEQVRPTSPEGSDVAPVENMASPDVENEQIAPISDAEVDVERHEQTHALAQTTRRAKLNGYLCHHQSLSQNDKSSMGTPRGDALAR